MFTVNQSQEKDKMRKIVIVFYEAMIIVGIIDSFMHHEYDSPAIS